MKYMVMETHLCYAVVLSENGEFIKAANLNYKVGQTVDEIIRMKVPTSAETPVSTEVPASTKAPAPNVQKKRSKYKYLYKIVAAAACMVLIFASVLQFSSSTYASVYLSINPEIRIDVSKNDIVKNVQALNDDGTLLLEDYSYKDKTLNLVTDELVDKAIAAGYLSDGGKISINIESKNASWTANKGDSLLQSTGNHLSEKIAVTITISGQGIETITMETTNSSAGVNSSDYDDNDSDDLTNQNTSGINSSDYGIENTSSENVIQTNSSDYSGDSNDDDDSDDSDDSVDIDDDSDDNSNNNEDNNSDYTSSNSGNSDDNSNSGNTNSDIVDNGNSNYNDDTQTNSSSDSQNSSYESNYPDDSSGSGSSDESSNSGDSDDSGDSSDSGDSDDSDDD